MMRLASCRENKKLGSLEASFCRRAFLTARPDIAGVHLSLLSLMEEL